MILYSLNNYNYVNLFYDLNKYLLTYLNISLGLKSFCEYGPWSTTLYTLVFKIQVNKNDNSTKGSKLGNLIVHSYSFIINII